MQTARLAKQIVQDLLWISQPFQILQPGQFQGLFTRCITGGSTDRRFIKKKPSLLHSDRDHADSRNRAFRSMAQCPEDLSLAARMRSTFGIPMNEEQVARVELHAQSDSLAQSLGRLREPAEIRPGASDRAYDPMPAQEPREDRAQHLVGATVRHEGEAKVIHAMANGRSA
jgi:hypothetical protein